MEIATFGGGCFWCTEAVFQRLKGVNSVTPGYTGGNLDNPNYQQVSSGETGHVEAIQITFDPKIITFEKLLEVFFAIHDPTTVNRQGSDVDTLEYKNLYNCLLTQSTISLIEITPFGSGNLKSRKNLFKSIIL